MRQYVSATKMESLLNIKSKTNDYTCEVYLIIFCFIVNFNVKADDCNLELSKNYPYFQNSYSDVEELAKEMDKILFLEMDENFDLQNEIRDLYFSEGEDAVKKFEEEYNLNSISLPCNQKKKIVDQTWEDFENMVTPGYNAMVCDNSQGLFYPLRKFKFSKKYKPCLD